MSKPYLKQPQVRELPHSDEAEQAVLGSILLHPDDETMDCALEYLGPHMFYRDYNRRIFEAMRDMFSRGLAVDTTTLFMRFHENQILDSIGGYHYLLGLTNTVPSASNIVHYAKIVNGQYQLRKNIEFRQQQEAFFDRWDDKGTYDGATMLLETLDQRSQQHAEERCGTQRGSFVKVGAQAEAVMLRMLAIASGTASRCKTGISDLDRIILPNIVPGTVSAWGGRPSCGKTEFMLQWLENVARNREPCLFVSCEMDEIRCSARLINKHLTFDWLTDLDKIDGEAQMKPWQTEEFTSATVDFVNNVDPWLDLWTESINKRWSVTQPRLRRYIRKHDPALIVVDYLQLMNPDNTYGNDRHDLRLGQMAQELYSLAKFSREEGRKGCHIAVIVHLNRNSEKREDKRPMLSEVREVGQVEQDVDLGVMFYRGEIHDDKQATPGVTELLLRKLREQRKGEAQRMVKIKMDRTGRFQAYDEHTRPAEFYPT